MSLKSRFELHFELHTQNFDYHNSSYRGSGKTAYLNTSRTAGGCIFHLILYFRLGTNSTYDQGFRTRPVHKLESACTVFDKSNASSDFFCLLNYFQSSTNMKYHKHMPLVLTFS